MSSVRDEPRDARGYPWVGGWNARDMYGLLSRGYPEMANAFMNQDRRGGAGGRAESFPYWVSQRGIGLESQIRLSRRGWWGMPRVPVRCRWPIGPCIAGCTARHIDADEERRAA